MVDDNDGVRVSPHRLGAVIQAPPAQEIHRQAMSPGGGERPVEARVGRIGNLLFPQHQPDPDRSLRFGPVRQATLSLPFSHPLTLIPYLFCSAMLFGSALSATVVACSAFFISPARNSFVSSLP